MSVTFEYIPLKRRVVFQQEKRRMRREWLERQHARNPRCYYCHNRTELMPPDYNMQMNHGQELVATLDHVEPLSAGGVDFPRNWRLACAICNGLKADMPEHEFIDLLTAEGIRG
jgi:hypothetical protein